jgi:hypothetical protein
LPHCSYRLSQVASAGNTARVELVDLVTIQQATLDGSGAIIGWTTFQTNVPARIQPDRTVVVTKSGEPPTSDAFYKVVLGVQVPLDHTCRIVGPDSAVYELVEYTHAERIDALPVAHVKRVS